MTASDKGEEEGDNEANSKSQEVKSASGEDEHWIEDLAQKLEIGSAKNQGHKGTSENAEEEHSTMSQEQVDLVHELCRGGISFTDIGKIMGLSEGSVDPYELKRVVMIANIMMNESINTQEENLHGQAHFRAEEAKFEPYDPVRWETAAEGSPVDETPPKEEASAPNPPDNVKEEVSGIPETAAVVPTSESDFVRALKNSKVGSKPYYKEGDILRVINKTSRRNLNGQRFELLPLKPPGESAEAFVGDFEPADQAAVDAVGREAYTEKEKDSFRCAVEWED